MEQLRAEQTDYLGVELLCLSDNRFVYKRDYKTLAVYDQGLRLLHTVELEGRVISAGINPVTQEIAVLVAQQREKTAMCIISEKGMWNGNFTF